MQIGPHSLPNRLFVAPMAGVTDRPFRQLCKALGAGYPLMLDTMVGELLPKNVLILAHRLNLVMDLSESLFHVLTQLVRLGDDLVERHAALQRAHGAGHGRAGDRYRGRG